MTRRKGGEKFPPDLDEKNDHDKQMVASWIREARENPPDIEQWAVFVARLRWIAETSRRGENHDLQLSAETASLESLAITFIDFICRHPFLKDGLLHMPLFRLVWAINDVKAGVNPELFRPRVKKPRRPGDDSVSALVRGICGSAMEELIAAGKPRKEAARLVCEIAKKAKVKGYRNLSPGKIEDWRDRLRLGTGGDNATALARFKARPEAGNDAASRAAWLLEVLKTSVALHEFLEPPIGNRNDEH